jgi:putative membrane protein
MKKGYWIILILLVCSIYAHLNPGFEQITRFLTEPTLYILNLASIFWLIKKNKFSTKLLVWLFFAYFLTFILEAFGTNTGLIFGDYIYGNIFILKLFNTPILIGLNWIVVTLGSFSLAKSLYYLVFKKPASTIFKNTFLIIITASIATFFDFFLEPVAIKYGYWNWQNSIIPVFNYISWFLISGFLTFVLIFLRVKADLKWITIWFIVQFIFMFVLYFSILFLS